MKLQYEKIPAEVKNASSGIFDLAKCINILLNKTDSVKKHEVSIIDIVYAIYDFCTG